MTVSRGFALLLTLATAGALVNASGSAGTGVGRLKTISARTNAKGSQLVIEASDPLAYVATRPDPLTLALDFRNVASEGVANAVAISGKGAIAYVSVEDGESLGTPVAHLHIALAQPVAHHIRSDRNTVIIEFDKPEAKAPYVLPPPVKPAPDAFAALQQQDSDAPAAEPISALSPDQAIGGPSAVSANRAAGDRTAVQRLRQPEVAAAAAAPQAQPPAPPTPAPQGVGGPQRNDRQFTGHPVSLDFQGADLRAVLRTFAEISGLNIVIDPTVAGTVDVALRDVPWDQALDIILRANKLGYLVDGTIVRIAPLTVLSEEEAQRRKLGEERALAGQLEVMTRSLSYARAEELITLLTKSSLSQRGTVQVDARTNTLIITDLPDNLTRARDLITTLDRAQPQVEIEARIVQTNKNYARALGVQWGFNGKVDPTLGNTTGLAFPNSGSLTGQAAGGTTAPPAGTAVNLGVAAAPNAIGLALGSVNGAFNLDVALTALESSGNGRLLSTPRVTTQNNIAAEMTQGVQIPIQTTANNTVTVSFKDAALTLKVTPQITAANTVIMLINLENATPDFSRSINGIPPINTQRAVTQVLVSDGQTTVIGGIYTSTTTNNTDKTPGLGEIPLLKWLFRREAVNDQNTELLVFI
ncbi:MAG TPA: type IV pilus secretin PilQ, partial [Vicinamibacterales bacterium]